MMLDSYFPMVIFRAVVHRDVDDELVRLPDVDPFAFGSFHNGAVISTVGEIRQPERRFRVVIKVDDAHEIFVPLLDEAEDVGTVVCQPPNVGVVG